MSYIDNYKCRLGDICLRPTLIGLSGKARSGKDTFGKELVKNSSMGWGDGPPYCYALASPIKKIINNLFGWDERHSEGHLKEVEVSFICPTHQQLLAEIKHYTDVTDTESSKIRELFEETILEESYRGSDTVGSISPRRAYQLFGTEVGRAVRDTIWLDAAQMLIDKGDSLIITDVRFENEAEWIRNQGGVLVHIQRDEAKEVVSHTSEVGVKVLDNDAVIHNNSSIQDLQYIARNFKNDRRVK